MSKTAKIRSHMAESLGKVATKINSVSWKLAPKCVNCGEPIGTKPCFCIRDTYEHITRRL